MVVAELKRSSPAEGKRLATPVVSCIIPAFNRKEMAVRAIDSLLEQDASFPYEIVVVDDGSTDGTSDYLRQRYQGVSEVRVVTKQNGGVSSARNRGISEASGEYVAFLDSDDRALPEHLGKLHAKLVADNSEFIHAKSYFVGENGERLNDSLHIDGIPMPRTHWGKVWNEVSSGQKSPLEQILDAQAGSPVHAQTVMVKRSLLDRAKAGDGHYFDEHLDFVEDFDLWKRLARRTNKVSFLNDYVSEYTTGTGNSFSNQGRAKLGKQAALSKDAAKQLLGKHAGVLLLTGSVRGSQEKHTSELCEGLYSNGITKISVLMQPKWFDGMKEYSSAKVTNAIKNDDYKNGSYFRDRAQRHSSLEGMLQAVNAGSYDFIHIIDNRWADEVAVLKQLGKPIVYKMSSLVKHEIDRDPSAKHLGSPMKKDPYGESVLQKQEKLLAAADIIHVQTEEYAQIAASHYPKHANKIHVVRNSPDFSEEELNDIIRNRKPDFNHFLCVGRLANVKGYEQTIKAFARVAGSNPRVRLDICGEMDDQIYTKKLFNLVENLGLQNNVKFHGKVDKAGLREFYKRAGALIQPSLHEQCSIAMLNAGSVGMPVICSMIPDFAGLYSERKKTALKARLVGNNGYNHADVSDLASKIKYVKHNPQSAKELGKNLQAELVRNGYTRMNVIQNVMQTYRKLAS